MTGIDASALLAEWLDELEAELPFASNLREELHRNPCLSGQEHDTRDRVRRTMGIDLKEVADSGAVGRVGPNGGPTVAVRGELDALPIVETTGVDWASTNGAMHACGHDVHLAALSAVVRSAQRLDLPYGLVPILQPREEAYPSGALDVRNAGVLDEYDVAHVIGVHVHPGVEVGHVATGGGFVNAAAGEIEIRVDGRGGHGAYPHLASDPIVAIAAIAAGIPEVLRRTVDPLIPALVSIGTLEAGNGAANVLPGSGRILATIRTTRDIDARRIVEAVTALAEGQAAAYGVVAQVAYTEGEPTLDNDVALSSEVDRLLPEAGLVASAPMRSLGADDFSYFSNARPSVMCFVGVTTVGVDGSPTLHDPEFLPDPDALRRVARTFIVGYLAAARRLSISRGS